MNAPPVTATGLAHAGRNPDAPFVIELADGRRLCIDTLLRILPGKRITGIATFEGQRVIAKLFIASSGSERHWQRECQGIELLRQHDFPTPQPLASGALKSGGHYVLTEFIDAALSLADAPAAAVAAAMPRLLALLGHMHACGLTHEDAHLGNFLAHGDTLFILDGDAIRGNQPTSALQENLALLLSQLPPDVLSDWWEPLTKAYRSGHPACVLDQAQLDRQIEAITHKRLLDYLDKCLRDCTLFKVEKAVDRFTAVLRSESGWLAPVIADPDRWMNDGTPLKQGRTATLAQVECGGRQLVIKRYNIKNTGHALSRALRPSRAWHSWVEGNRLKFLGIATPRPLALIEQRFGPLRGKAWLITDFSAGESVAARYPPAGRIMPPDAELAAIGKLFRQLLAARICHGDLKATNLLQDGDRISLIDLDAMRQHGSNVTFWRAWRKDCARFLENWPASSTLRKKLAETLPAL
jgi:tRNA A-37 threonylcarbamoyl transferase component Bud32